MVFNGLSCIFSVGDSVTSRNDEDDVGRSIDTDSKGKSKQFHLFLLNANLLTDSGIRSTSDDTRDRKSVGSRGESGRGAAASTFEEATTGESCRRSFPKILWLAGHIGKHDKSAENIGSVGDNGSSINAPTTSSMFSCVLITFLWTHSLEDAPETDNSTYKSSDPTGGSTRTSRDDAEEGTDHNNYGRPPYDVTNVDRDSQTTSSDGQTLPSQRGSSTLVNDQQGRDATTDTSKTSGEDVDNTGASTFDDQPSVNEDQTSSEGFQRDRHMTSDTPGQDTSSTTSYGKSPYDATGSVHDSRTTSSDGRPSSIQRSSSALHDDQQGRDAAAAKTSKADLDNNGVPTFDNQTSSGKDQSHKHNE